MIFQNKCHMQYDYAFKMFFYLFTWFILKDRLFFNKYKHCYALPSQDQLKYRKQDSPFAVMTVMIFKFLFLLLIVTSWLITFFLGPSGWMSWLDWPVGCWRLPRIASFSSRESALFGRYSLCLISCSTWWRSINTVFPIHRYCLFTVYKSAL